MTRVAYMCFLVTLDLLALEMRPLESCVIATVFNWDFMLGIIDRRVRFSPCTLSAYSGMIQGQLYPLMVVTCVKNQGGCPYEYLGYGDLSAVMVSCFRTNHVESRVGVVAPRFGRQRRQMQLFPLPFPSLSLIKRVKNKTLVAHRVRQWSP